MNFKVLMPYIKGYLRVEIEGYFIERLMNLCANKSILLWKSNRKKSTLLDTNVRIKDFKKIIKLAKETKCKIRIKRKSGLPFIFNRYRKRKVFLVLFTFIIMCLIVLSNFIWNIEIEGNEKVSNMEILKSLKEQGLYIGSLKTKINQNEIINKLRLERNDLAWIGIEIKGTNAKIKIAEIKKKPDIIDENEFCNIVATKPGIITKITAQNGTALVKEGDLVNEKTVLIGGWLDGKYTGTRYVHANGNVQAKVWYKKNKKIELNQVKLSETGNSENKYSVKINNFQINFYKTLSKFKKYDTIDKNKKIKLFSNFYLPIEIIKKTNFEQVEENVKYSKEEAKKIAVCEAKKELDDEIIDKDNLVNIYINYNETASYIEAQVIYEVLEEIGTKEKIVF